MPYGVLPKKAFGGLSSWKTLRNYSINAEMFSEDLNRHLSLFRDLLHIEVPLSVFNAQKTCGGIVYKEDLLVAVIQEILSQDSPSTLSSHKRLSCCLLYRESPPKAFYDHLNHNKYKNTISRCSTQGTFPRGLLLTENAREISQNRISFEHRLRKFLQVSHSY